MSTQGVKEKEIIYLVIMTDRWQEDYQAEYAFKHEDAAKAKAEELIAIARENNDTTSQYIVQPMNIEDT